MGETALLLLHYVFAGLAVAALPLIGAAVWALVREEESELERRERQLLRRLREDELYGGERCVGCREHVEPHWLRCPSCTEPLKTRCECGALLKLHWTACPWCAGAGLERVAAPAREPVAV